MTARKRPLKYEQVEVGEWIRLTKRHYDMCCGCGMVHEMEYRVADDGVFEMRVVRIVRWPRRKAASGNRRT